MEMSLRQTKYDKKMEMKDLLLSQYLYAKKRINSDTIVDVEFERICVSMLNFVTINHTLFTSEEILFMQEDLEKVRYKDAIDYPNSAPLATENNLMQQLRQGLAEEIRAREAFLTGGISKSEYDEIKQRIGAVRKDLAKYKSEKVKKERGRKI